MMRPNRVLILDLKESIIVVIHDSCLYPGDSGLFIWQEGNYACDCNRQLISGRIIVGRDIDTVDEIPCGEGRYFVRLEEPDGTLIWEDWPESFRMISVAR